MSWSHLAPRLVGAAVLLATAVVRSPAPALAANCTFVLGFGALHSLIPGVSGWCVEDEHHNPANGDGLQATAKGLMVWRKADNWTAFTDGYRTWINGPYGLQERLNTQRFSWEGGQNVPAVATQAGPPPSSWLDRLNYYRGAAGLGSVSEDGSLDPGAANHARYIVKNAIVEHTEDSGNPWYTAAGAAAGGSSDLIGFSWQASDAEAIDGLIEGPFHALSMLDAALQRVGYSSYRQSGTSIQMGADLYFGAGWGGYSGAGPTMWPANGSSFPLHSLVQNEMPNPLTSCPGYSSPAGFPIMLILGRGGSTPSVSGHALTQNGAPIAHCVFDATNYVNPDAGAQSVGRAILGASNAIVILPRSPLVGGSTYHVSVTTNGRTYSWSFLAS
jgi:Cysteine-rich secretory protein family